MKYSIAPQVDGRLRWMKRQDLPAVVEIERYTFGDCAWDDDDFIANLRDRCCIGVVVEVDTHVVGYCLYELHLHKLTIINLAVAPEWRRRGLGAGIVGWLIGKLSADRRNRIEVVVRETNLGASLFFRAQGFRAVSLLKDFYDDTTEDAYLFLKRFETLVDETNEGGSHVVSNL